MESTQETAEEITCERCGQVEEIFSLGLCGNCLSDYDDERQEREDHCREEDR
jgi:hypothetical protein